LIVGSLGVEFLRVGRVPRFKIRVRLRFPHALLVFIQRTYDIIVRAIAPYKFV